MPLNVEQREAALEGGEKRHRRAGSGERVVRRLLLAAVLLLCRSRFHQELHGGIEMMK